MTSDQMGDTEADQSMEYEDLFSNGKNMKLVIEVSI